MNSVINPDLIVPHGVCSHCAELTSKAECLYVDINDIDDRPHGVQHVIDTNATPLAMATNAKRGCHLCSIMFSKIMGDKSLTAASSVSEEHLATDYTIYAVICYNGLKLREGKVTSEKFTLELFRGEPILDSSGNWANKTYRRDDIEEDIVPRRIRKEFLAECQLFEHCHLKDWPQNPSAQESVNKQTRLRWTNCTGSDTTMEVISKLVYPLHN